METHTPIQCDSTSTNIPSPVPDNTTPVANPSNSTDNPTTNVDTIIPVHIPVANPSTSTDNPTTNADTIIPVANPSTSTDNPTTNTDTIIPVHIPQDNPNTTTSTINIPSTLEVWLPLHLRKMAAVASIAAGIQFGWALQLSLLTPYVQLLGIPHQWASIIWLCGPISGLVIQPLVGYYSDRCQSQFGRRRPFIFFGVIAVAMAAFLISSAADLGHALGDGLHTKTKPRAVAIFVLGFWILDVANNLLQGPCRAFIGDLAAGDPRRMRTGNGLFSFFMAIGNVLGYSAGSMAKLHNLFPFTETEACHSFCSNLKICFFFSVFLLTVLSTVALLYVEDVPVTLPASKSESQASCFGELLGAFNGLPSQMWMLMVVTAINWVAWFPLLLFDTDWMGHEVYGGNPGDTAYANGVRMGAKGLMVNAVVLGLMSLAVEPLGRKVGGAKRLWGGVNVLLAICFAMTVLITKAAQHERHNGGNVGTPSAGVKASAFVLFAVLGVPLAVNFSVPFALASIYSNATKAGQGLYLGVLNISIVTPQIIVSSLSGQWDKLFGGGNVPSFVVGAVAAFISAILAIVLLPTPTTDEMANVSTGGGFH